MSYGESGFGSPSVSSAEIYDAGFGTPSSFAIVNRDTGFGSPFDPTLSAYAADAQLVGDDGGYQVRLVGPFVAGEQYTINLLNPNTGLRWECHSGYSSQIKPISLYGNYLYVYTPPAPQGDYYFEIIQPGGGAIQIANAVTLTNPATSKQTLSLRRSLPGFYKAGSRDIVSFMRGEQQSMLSALTAALGDSLRKQSGKILTGLTSDWTWGDSTLSLYSAVGFEEEGEVYVADNLFSYSGISGNILQNVQPLRVYSYRLTTGEEVTPHVE